MEAEKLSPLKGSWFYIWVSNTEKKNDKNTTNGEEDSQIEVHRVQDQKNKELISTEDVIGNQKESDHAQIEIIDENVDKIGKFSMQKMTTIDVVKESKQNYEMMIHEIDEIIENLKIDIFIKQVIEDKTLVQMFIPEDKIEDVLHEVNYMKQIGFKPGTAVSLLPTTLNYHGFQKTAANCAKEATKEKRKKKMAQFYNTLKSRMVVAEIIDKIEAGADFTFDYVALVMVAAILAFMGLIENSPVNLVASMLVSPIMGPILAGTFGINIRHGRLIKIGVKRELYSLLICIVMGFFLGIMLLPFLEEYKTWTNTQSEQGMDWPTDQMNSRTQSRGLLTGILIALPSGVGVALSILGGNAGSLVGVAISASLLPPAVNAGLFWAMSFFESISPSCSKFQPLDFPACTNRTYVWSNHIHDSFSVEDMDHPYERLPLQYFVRGLVSLLLTLLNIVCIVVMGTICLWIKEVTPHKIPQRNAQLWSNVNYNKTIKKKKSDKKQADLKDLFQEMEIPEEKQMSFVQDAIEDLANDEDIINIRSMFFSNPVKKRRSDEFTFEDNNEDEGSSGIQNTGFELQERNLPRRRNGTRARNRMSKVQKKVMNKIEKEIQVERNQSMTDAAGLTIT